MQPRFIRLRFAPDYLGMDRNRFNREVRPYVMEIRIGKQGVAFDRVDLDAWADEYKSRNGRPVKAKGGKTWDARKHRVSGKGIASGTSTSRSKDMDAFQKALAPATTAKRKSI